MRNKIIILCVPFLLASASAHAAQCDPKDESQMGLNLCAAAGYSASDNKLNAAYGQIMKRLSDDADSRKLLQTSQRAWVAFRDAECKFSVGASSDGSIYPMLVSQCLQGMTDDRIKQLDHYLHCQEGDLSCPVTPG